jgi:3'-phosphoadenosine 5'-phosphosulfate sulfotransferase (PAPS reductase)/FAD synthetase
MEKYPYPPAYLEANYVVRTEPKEQRTIEKLKKSVDKETRLAVGLNGKDSLVSLDIVKRAGLLVDAVVISAYVANRRLPQEVINELAEIAKRYTSNVIIYDRPWDVHTSLFYLISREFGYKTIVSGVRKRENRNHCCFIEHYHWGTLVNPVIDWRVSEIWSYIYHYRLPVPSAYQYAIRPETSLQYLVL